MMCYFGGFIEWTSGDSISERIVEGKRINYVFMSFESKKFFSSMCVPNFASSIITSSDKSKYKNEHLSPFLLKAQLVKGSKCVFRVLNNLNSWFFLLSIFSINSKMLKYTSDESFELWFLFFCDDWLWHDYLVYQFVHIGSSIKISTPETVALCLSILLLTLHSILCTR